MPAGARRSLASPTVVNGVLCQCGGVSSSASSSFSSGGGEAASRFLAEHERRLYSLFAQLDINRDGALCVHDLAVGLERLGLHRSERDLWVSLAPLPPQGGSTRALEHACQHLYTPPPGLAHEVLNSFLDGLS
ncbi:calcium-binding mitochondrial carrier protein SCaMC-2-like [Notechis scutatus]|uniref:Calcium-binding mitochondrial carrier protein SCaMC-2-like n=1 Tax=Notechis scutatus TaxID=8663 RepID=A0A6J1VP93_9SAUR|nr:calcium-binding mitochondrial carrier protein SCaMC-2-like [Notechis scutatus]